MVIICTDSDQYIRFWLSHHRVVKAQMSLCIYTVSPEHSVLAYTKYDIKPLSQRVDSLRQLSEIDYILEAMPNLPYVDI